jgi:putative ABC transport system ATP-binding protein
LTAAVELRALGKSYREGDDEHVVLAGADATIAAGEAVALLGPSGSGKSTLLNLIAGLDTPTTGAVLLEGRSLADRDDRQRTLLRRHAIGFVFQFFHLVPTLTVLENVLLPLELVGRADAAGRERALGLLADVGLGHRGGAWPDRLSGGEQQRVAVARALVHGPRLVLADEPTGNLDAAAGAAVLDLLLELTRAAGATLVLVTHSPEAAARADRVLRLLDGRLTAAPAAPPAPPA